jgi:hypothetical protein
VTRDPIQRSVRYLEGVLAPCTSPLVPLQPFSELHGFSCSDLHTAELAYHVLEKPLMSINKVTLALCQRVFVCRLHHLCSIKFDPHRSISPGHEQITFLKISMRFQRLLHILKTAQCLQSKFPSNDVVVLSSLVCNVFEEQCMPPELGLLFSREPLAMLPELGVIQIPKSAPIAARRSGFNSRDHHVMPARIIHEYVGLLSGDCNSVRNRTRHVFFERVWFWLQ